MFSGTQCQVKGLHNYLGKNYSNLLLVDLLCYGIPSPKVFHKYLEETYPDAKIKNINMREKSIAWDKYCMKIQIQDAETVFVPKTKDLFLKSYAKALYIRESCFSCNIKGFPRISDLTLGDCWDFEKICTDTSRKDKGISLVSVNSERGGNVFNSLKDISIIDFDRAKLDSIHPYFCVSERKNSNYKKFKANVDKYTLRKLVVKYTRKDIIKVKLKKTIKKILGR